MGYDLKQRKLEEDYTCNKHVPILKGLTQIINKQVFWYLYRMLVYWPGTYIVNIQRIHSAEVYRALRGFNITEVGRTQEKYLTTCINILKSQQEM